MDESYHVILLKRHPTNKNRNPPMHVNSIIDLKGMHINPDGLIVTKKDPDLNLPYCLCLYVFD